MSKVFVTIVGTVGTYVVASKLLDKYRTHTTRQQKLDAIKALDDITESITDFNNDLTAKVKAFARMEARIESGEYYPCNRDQMAEDLETEYQFQTLIPRMA